MCVTGDMTWLAVKLSELGVGDYWEDADQYVRNQLTEQQITDESAMDKVVATMPKLVETEYPEFGRIGSSTYSKIGPTTTDHVVHRHVGAYRSDASNPTLIRPAVFRRSICCSGNCPPGLFAVWDATVRHDGGVARINFLLNRASPWLDMDSYLPYEGKVVIRNKSVEKVFVRIPRWVADERVSVEVNGKKSRRTWVGRYLFVEGLRAGDQIRIDFPIVESKETYTLKWKAEDFWMEATDPGSNWKPHDAPDQFTLHLRGNTVVDVSPRTEGPGYPLYVRNELTATTAPIREVKRFVSSTVVKW
jgi:hypothetical protein